MKMLKRTDAAAFALEGRLFMGVFAGRVRTADVAAQEESIAVAAGQQKILAISWIGESLTLSRRGRERMQAMLKNVEPHILAWAIVIPAGSLWSALARTITSGARLVSGATYPFRVFDGLDPARVWLSGHLADPGIDAAAVHLAKLRAMVAPAPAPPRTAKDLKPPR